MSADRSELEEPQIRQWLKEPFLHFLVIGAVVFLLCIPALIQQMANLHEAEQIATASAVIGNRSAKQYYEGRIRETDELLDFYYEWRQRFDVR